MISTSPSASAGPPTRLPNSYDAAGIRGGDDSGDDRADRSLETSLDHGGGGRRRGNVASYARRSFRRRTKLRNDPLGQLDHLLGVVDGCAGLCLGRVGLVGRVAVSM